MNYSVRLRQYPSLVNCTTIDWFLDWPKEALLEVAFKSLTTVEILETITGAPRVCSNIFYRRYGEYIIFSIH